MAFCLCSFPPPSFFFTLSVMSSALSSYQAYIVPFWLIQCRSQPSRNALHRGGEERCPESVQWHSPDDLLSFSFNLIFFLRILSSSFLSKQVISAFLSLFFQRGYINTSLVKSSRVKKRNAGMLLIRQQIVMSLDDHVACCWNEQHALLKSETDDT